jgi:hypothetical protein
MGLHLSWVLGHTNIRSCALSLLKDGSRMNLQGISAFHTWVCEWPKVNEHVLSLKGKVSFSLPQVRWSLLSGISYRKDRLSSAAVREKCIRKPVAV